MRSSYAFLAAVVAAACQSPDLAAPPSRVAPPLAAVANESDALAISANVQASHTPFATVIDPVYASGDPASPDFTRLVGYSRAADAAIWTGHYLAAEAFRFNVTKSPDALANVRREVDAIRALVDVPGTGVLARFTAPASSPYTAGIVSGEAQHGIYEGTLNGETQCWLGNTSRDQYTGVFFGLGVAYDMVKDDDPKLQRRIANTISRMLSFLVKNGWNVPMPPEPVSTVCPHGTAYDSYSTTFLQRPDQRLAFLQIGRHVDSTRFWVLYVAERAVSAEQVPVPIVAECQDNHGSYYKFNLDYANLYNLIRLEEPDSPYLTFYRAAFTALRDGKCTGAHRNAHFDAIDFALTGNAASASEAEQSLGLWLDRPRRDYYKDLSQPPYSYPVCGDRSCVVIAVNDRVNTDFLWQRSPYQLTGGKDGTIETAGIDYILPYWMSRYYQGP